MRCVRAHVFAIVTLAFCWAGCSRRVEREAETFATTATANRARYGAAALYVRFPENATGRAQPLVTSGKPGASDGLFVRYVAEDRIRLGYDHWGAGVVESAEIAVVPGAIHALRVSMPSLMGQATRGKRAPLAEVLAVELDGKWVWRRNVRHHPAPAESIGFGRNRVGLGSFEPEFSGVIALVERENPPDEPWPASDPAAIELEVELPIAPRIGACEPLVSYGVTGAADVLLLEYSAEKRIRFGLDHWSRPLQQSEWLKMPDGVQRIRVAYDRKSPPDEQGVTVWLNGMEVWRVKQALYPATHETLEICTNSVGASSCEPTFSGALLGLRFFETR